MVRLNRMMVFTCALLPLACGGDSGDDGGTSFSSVDESGSADEIGTESSDSSGDSTGDGDGESESETAETSTDSTDAETTDDTESDSSESESDSTESESTSETDATETESTSDGMMMDTDIPCDEFEVTLDPLPPNVMLVLDKSRSMFINYWDHDNNANTPTITRWNSLHQVVSTILGNFDDKINFGSILFPSTAAQNVYGPSACITSDFPDVTVGPMNGASILAAIPGANVVNSYGGTPATLGIQTAYEHLDSLNPSIPRAMILVTDGAANCSETAQTNEQLFEFYDTALPTLVGQAHADGIDTYVVGVNIANMVVNDGVGGDPNNINPAMKLNEVAQAGGTGSFVNSQDQQQLLNALNTVIESVKTCVIPLDEAPVFPEFTKVFVNNQEWPMVDDCNSENGWVYSNPYDEIELCGTACDALKDAEQADIEYHCNPG